MKRLTTVDLKKHFSILLIGAAACLTGGFLICWAVTPKSASTLASQEMPNRFIEQEADGARVRFIYFEPMHQLAPGEKRTIVIVFYDWKNNTPIKQVVFQTDEALAADRIFYSDGDMISALVSDHVLFNYDKKTQVIQRRDFDPKYQLIKPTSDWQRIIAIKGLDEGGSKMVILDKDGKETASQSALNFMSENLTLTDGDRVAEIKTEAEGNIPSAYYRWDLVANTVTKEPRITGENDPLSQRTETGSAVLFGGIEQFAQSNDGGQVALRLMEWVDGSNNQEQAALESGICTLQRIERDECLPNGFFIRKTEKLLTLPLSNDLKINIFARDPGHDGMVSDANGSIYLESVDRTVFDDRIQHDSSFKLIPFIVTTKNGEVTKIEERYVP